jgi:hypothetical protein
MIEGTKPFRGRHQSPQSPTTKAKSDEASAPIAAHTSAPDAANLERREWFAELIPAFGAGLVKILRVSNNLRDDIHDAMKTKAKDLVPKKSEDGADDESRA